MTSAVTVLLHYDKDPEVFDFETGEDISKHCASVILQPGRKSIAKMCKVDKNGAHYHSTITDSVATYFVQVLSVSGYGMCRTHNYTPGWRDFA
jgi:hypothetical protein